MNVFLQIIIGLIPVTVIAVVALIISKNKRLSLGVCLFVICAMLGGATVLFYTVPIEQKIERKKVTETADNELFNFFYALLEKGENELANEVLAEAGNTCYYGDEYVLACARMAAIKGDNLQAGTLYALLGKSASKDMLRDCKAEFDLFAMKDSFSSNRELTEAAIEAIHRDLYGDIEVGSVDVSRESELLYETASLERSDSPAVHKKHDDVDKEEKIDVYAEAADMYLAAKELLVQWNSYGYVYDTEKLETVITWFEKAQKSLPFISELPFMEDAYLCLEVTTENYDSLIVDIADAGYKRLIVVTELYRIGAIDVDDFRNDAGLSKEVKNCKTLKEWIRENSDDYEYTDEEQALLDEVLQYASLFDTDEGAGLWIIELMEEKAVEESENASQIYLELSHLYYDNEEDEKAGWYVDKALDCALASDDPAYYQAAEKILEVINNPDDTEARKNIGDYATNWVAEILPDEIDNLDTFVKPQEEELPKPSEEPEKEEPKTPVTNPFERHDRDNKDDDTAASKDDDTDVTSQGDNNANRDSFEDFVVEETTQEPVVRDSFENFISEEVNLKSASITITSIDASKFDTVTAVVAVDSSIAATAEEFRNNLSLKDCNTEITDYYVEKVNYQAINMVLCCDKSGSMSGAPIENLKSACSTLVEKFCGEANIGIVMFDSGVSSSIAPTNDKASLNDFISQIYSGGGTNISSGVYSSINMLSGDGEVLNLIIVMSDGNDSFPSENTLKQYKASCNDKKAFIYTAGLGSSVNSGVLSAYSNECGGNYLYIEDSASIVKYYNYIYGISLNTYKVVYTALDKNSLDRNLYIEKNDSRSSYASKDYYLYERDFMDEGETRSDYEVSFGDIIVKGLDTNLIYQSDYETKVKLIGENFDETDVVKLKLKAGMEYSLECTYVDEHTYEAVIPANPACGMYDLEVKINNDKRTLAKELIITSTDRNVVVFGDYVFTATNISDSGNVKVLSGIVDMNGWYYFKDPLTITGNTDKDYSVSLSFGKTYVQYADPNKLTGTAKFLADNGYFVEAPQLSGTIIYNDICGSDSDSFPVYYAKTKEICIQGLMATVGNNTTAALYPDKVVVSFSNILTKFPYAAKVWNKLGAPISFGDSKKLIFSEDGIDCEFKVKAGTNDNTPTALGNLPLGLAGASIEVEVNTKDGDYSVGAEVELPGKITTGLTLEWKDSKFDALDVGADVDIPSAIGPLECTFSNFHFGVKDLSKSVITSEKELLYGEKARCKGSFDLGFYEVKIPWIGKKISPVKLSDVFVEYSLNEFYISFGCKVKVFELIECGSCKAQIGKGLKYENVLIEMTGGSIDGVIGSVSKGMIFDFGFVKSNTQGETSLALTNEAVGLYHAGILDIEVIKLFDIDSRGYAYVGFSKKHNGNWCVGIYAQWVDDNNKCKHWEKEKEFK